MSSDPLAGRRFFFAISLAILALVLVGFAPTLYLRAFLDAPPVPAYLIVHGIALTAWFSGLFAPAIARWGLGGDMGPFVPLVMLLLGALAWNDWRTLGRMHPATLAGADLIVALAVVGQLATHWPAGRAFVAGPG